MQYLQATTIQKGRKQFWIFYYQFKSIFLLCFYDGNYRPGRSDTFVVTETYNDAFEDISSFQISN